MRWSVIPFIIFFCFACQSKPVPTTMADSAALQAKVTREAPALNKAEYGMRVIASPRKAQELEAGLLGHPEVKKCADAAAHELTSVLNVQISGKISKNGTLDDISLTRASKGFELCMGLALKAVNLGQGRAGTFKLQLFRTESKNQIKKFE